MIDLVLVKKDMLYYVVDERAVKGMDEVSQIIMLFCAMLGWWVPGLRGERW